MEAETMEVMETIGAIYGAIIFLYIIIVVLICWVSWILGKFLGKRLSQTTGLVIGILLILCGFSLFVGIPCIIYSAKNKEKTLDMDFNINSKVTSNNRETLSEIKIDTRECPYCAETIKKKAITCRFCGKTLEPLA